jgi:tripartite-type tricarboxylate transporter receptor subunit TctC
MTGFNRFWLFSITAMMIVLGIVACGSDPTATPKPAATPTDTPPTATPTVAVAGVTPLPAKPTPTATAVPTATPTGRDLEKWFGGKTVKVTVPYSPGGGYDVFARLFSRFAPKHFPGEPRFLVRNLPGSGGERGLVNVMEKGNRDGFAVVVVHPRFFKRELLGDDVPSFDLETTSIVGTPTAVAGTIDSTYMMVDKFDGNPLTYAGAVAMAEKRGSPLTRGGNAVGDSATTASTFVEAIGGPVKMVYGYGGSSELMAALDRGELDIGPCDRANASALFPEWVEENRCIPLWRVGPMDANDDPDYVDWITNYLGREIPPHLFDLIDVTPGQRDVFALIETVNDQLSRTYALPPEVPDDIVEAWRASFKATIEDPEFVQAAELLGRRVLYGSPEQMDAGLKAGAKALQDPELRALFAKMAGPPG